MVEVNTIDDLLEFDDILASVEKFLRADEKRKEVLKIVPKGGIGAEIGVFTGKFSEALYEVTKPSKLYLVDVWHTQFGELFPDWGPYTAKGKLSTASALKAATLRAENMGESAEIVLNSSHKWLATMPPYALDWAYIDSSHGYDGTFKEIDALLTVLKPDGIILGDDCQINPLHRHHGVFRAIRDHAAKGALEVIYMDNYTQWAMRRRSS